MELTGRRKMAGKLVVKRKNWQIPTKNCGKLTRNKFSFNCNRKKLIISRKSYYPIETFLKLVTIWRCSDFFFLIVQINILFFTRVILVICIHFSFSGFISVSCFWLMYVTPSTHLTRCVFVCKVSSFKKLLE